MSNGEKEFRYNEINNFIDCRYVSAPEAMWRIRESKMHDKSHSVLRLPVHLPNQQRVIFEEGHEEEALLAAQTGKTKLESWFLLNANNIAARVHFYTDIPYHYVYVKGQWQERQRGGEKTIGRMYTVCMKDEERFYLRLLLLHVPGATSFEYLRTVKGNLCESFKAAAIERGLLESDEEWDRCLTDAATYLMPKQLRDMFSYICIFCQPSLPIKLWKDHQNDLSLDYLRTHSVEESTNLALHAIDFVLNQHGMVCGSIGLPTPTGDAPEDIHLFDREKEKKRAQEKIEMLNEAQTAAFVKIVMAVENMNTQGKFFYIDGPGGSGKTFLYQTLLAYYRAKGKVVLPFATTGIAATMMEGGRTVHSGFKLPVPLLDNSVSSMRLSSPEAAVLREAVLIIIDEITMLPKQGLRCIDKLLRDIMRSNINFGGKFLFSVVIFVRRFQWCKEEQPQTSLNAVSNPVHCGICLNSFP
ncbi:ATP-dependent DNA helicase pif1 [Thelohanellus kitauei]|uniref:ATP-dependent DNA helicase n=1 Tax=Thelohanellus kitauei TaxID=669202 RepID=A0A0C2JGP7_THEKT|nr:ATP-dependent DNA helicase pif1 [Thelohanellus kitauei]